MKQRVFPIMAPIAGVVLMASLWGLPQHCRAADQDSGERSSVRVALRLLEQIPEEHRAEALLQPDSDRRTDWHFVPRDRPGVRISDLSQEAKDTLFELLGLTLSQKGVEQTRGVIRLEEVLLELEGAATRDPGKFHILFIGDPSEENSWGWRFEGHHVSLNASYRGEQIQGVTPCFFGANPAEVLDGPWKGFRNFPDREDVADEFMRALGKAERDQAILPDEPSDVIGAQQATLEPDLGRGLPIGSLSETQKALFRELLECYLSSFDEDVLKVLGRTSGDLMKDPDLVFQWRGGIADEDRHCYRICGHTVDIQYANQNPGINHIHSLVFFPGTDFGGNR